MGRHLLVAAHIKGLGRGRLLLSVCLLSPLLASWSLLLRPSLTRVRTCFCRIPQRRKSRGSRSLPRLHHQIETAETSGLLKGTLPDSWLSCWETPIVRSQSVSHSETEAVLSLLFYPFCSLREPRPIQPPQSPRHRGKQLLRALVCAPQPLPPSTA